MKKYSVIGLLVLMSFTKTANDAVDRIGVKGPLTFNKTIFNLAWTSKPTDDYYIQEYLPDSENVDHFNQMLTIYLLKSDSKLKSAVNQKVKELEERKKTDASCNYMVTESPGAKEYMVDFILGEFKDDKMTVLEFNIYRYKQVDLGNGKKGILAYAYSRRTYDDITTVFKALREERITLLNTMIAYEMPAITIQDK